MPDADDLPGLDTDAGFFLSPESRAIRDVYVDLSAEFGEVDVVVDLHHMGPCSRITGGPQDGKHISVALDYPPLGVDDGAAYQEDWPQLDQDASRRYALAVALGMQDAYGEQSPLAAPVWSHSSMPWPPDRSTPWTVTTSSPCPTTAGTLRATEPARTGAGPPTSPRPGPGVPGCAPVPCPVGMRHG